MSTVQALDTETVKYSTQLPPALIKWVKRQAVELEVKDYTVIVSALEVYRQQLQATTPQPVSFLEPAA